VKPTRVAAIQMASGPKVDANLERAGKLVHEAAAQGAQLVGLPENCGLIGARERDKIAHAEADGGGPMQDWLAATAASEGVWLVGGTVPIAAPGGERVRQSVGVYDDRGKRVARYDKMHLFDVQLANGETYRESATIEPGDEPVVVDSPFGRLGVAVCYDLRFPELFRRLGEQGAEMFVVPSAFTKATGRAHWDVLVRARAVENLAFVVAPAQGGYHYNERETWGHTMVVDPWGTVLAWRESDAGVVVTDLDAQMLGHTRENFPAIQHRRLS